MQHNNAVFYSCKKVLQKKLLPRKHIKEYILRSKRNEPVR